MLEVTPNEFKKLPIPYYEDIPDKNMKVFYKKNLSQLEDILLNNDEYLLIQKLNFSKDEVRMICDIRKRLLNKRLKRKI